MSGPIASRNRTAAVVTSGAGLVALVVGTATTGSDGVLSAVVGTALVLAFFAAGALPLLVAGEAGRSEAGLGFLVLAMTYVLRLVLAVAVLTVATQSGAVDRQVLGLTVIGCALVWTGTQVVLGARRQQPGLDL